MSVEEQVDIEAIKARNRATWAAGDYAALDGHLQKAGEAAVRAVGAGPGVRLLDVAAGAGNSALQAAALGAEVVASDLTPELVEQGRTRAAERGLDMTWQVADAEALPFEDAYFDAVVSTFGVMFAPRQDVAAGELVRVLKPGGRLALCNWTPDGEVGRFFKLISGFLPPPPGVPPPLAWGDPDHVRRLLEPHGVVPSFEKGFVALRYPDVDAYYDEFVPRFGPLVMARAALEPQGRWDELAGAIHALYTELARPDGDGLAWDLHYLLTTATR